MIKETIIQIKVKPNAPKFLVEINDQIIIHCKSPPKQNKANLEIIKELKRFLKKDVEIISGFTAKKKRILVHNISGEEVKRLLKTWK